MKALARYQIILLGEQRHIRCEQLAQGCCSNNAAVGVEHLLITSPTPYRYYRVTSVTFTVSCFLHYHWLSSKMLSMANRCDLV